ncbi:MAG: hypothetical protein HWD61_11975 [Parachlamydiaceae bacterium]|nr:MAG: hypothetical protein HWD61_11975 [Parachlamydiaceae bacterium]
MPRVLCDESQSTQTKLISDLCAQILTLLSKDSGIDSNSNSNAQDQIKATLGDLKIFPLDFLMRQSILWCAVTT